MINNYFKHIYCINLDRRKDRWSQVSKEFAEIGILDTVKKFVAIDGSKVNRNSLNFSLEDHSVKYLSQPLLKILLAKILKNLPKYLFDRMIMSNGEVGCLLSHIEIIKEAEKKGFENVLIFEDDVVFCDDFNAKLAEFMANVPSDWDMIYLGGNHNYHTGNKPEQVNKHVIKCNKTIAIHAIVVKNSIYKHILDINSLTKPIDLVYEEIQENSNVYAPCISIAKQRAGYSDIRKRQVNYDKWIK